MVTHCGGITRVAEPWIMEVGFTKSYLWAIETWFPGGERKVLCVSFFYYVCMPFWLWTVLTTLLCPNLGSLKLWHLWLDLSPLETSFWNPMTSSWSFPKDIMDTVPHKISRFQCLGYQIIFSVTWWLEGTNWSCRNLLVWGGYFTGYRIFLSKVKSGLSVAGSKKLHMEALP